MRCWAGQHLLLCTRAPPKPCRPGPCCSAPHAGMCACVHARQACVGARLTLSGTQARLGWQEGNKERGVLVPRANHLHPTFCPANCHTAA
jgi:hypothetical protein